MQVFQSTPPARAATSARMAGLRRSMRFNPRRPRGRRPCSYSLMTSVSSSFQSTPPARAATSDVDDGNCVAAFQSTPPARAATYGPRRSATVRYLFQSTPPARAATMRIDSSLGT